MEGVELSFVTYRYSLLTSLSATRLASRQVQDCTGRVGSSSPLRNNLYRDVTTSGIGNQEPARPRFLLTEVGVGYRLVAEN